MFGFAKKNGGIMNNTEAQTLRQAIEMFRNGSEESDITETVYSLKTSGAVVLSVRRLYELSESGIFRVEIPNFCGGIYSKDELRALLCDKPATLLACLRANEGTLAPELQRSYEITCEVYKEKRAAVKKNLEGAFTLLLVRRKRLDWDKNNSLYAPLVKKLE